MKMMKGSKFFLGSESILEGAALEINGTARVDGTLIGKIRVKHLIVGKPARVQGDIQSETADIEGIVEDIKVKGKLTIRKTGCVRGKISYGSLETEEGAILIGEVSTNRDAEWDSESVEEVENNDRPGSLVNSMNDDVEEPNPEDIISPRTFFGSLETEEGAKLIGEVSTNWNAEWDSKSVEEVENNDRPGSLVNSMNDDVDEPNPEDIISPRTFF